MSNPFFDAQARLAALIKAHAYFAALPDDQLLTEQVGDLENRILNSLLPLGFGVVITTAKGGGSSSLNLIRGEDTLTITIIHNPTLDPAHNALDALWAAQQAVIGQPLTAATVVRREDDVWRYAGHERRLDAPPELHVHLLNVTAKTAVAV